MDAYAQQQLQSYKTCSVVHAHARVSRRFDVLLALDSVLPSELVPCHAFRWWTAASCLVTVRSESVEKILNLNSEKFESHSHKSDNGDCNHCVSHIYPNRNVVTRPNNLGFEAPTDSADSWTLSLQSLQTLH